jgi:hypothetical protein
MKTNLNRVIKVSFEPAGATRSEAAPSLLMWQNHEFGGVTQHGNLTTPRAAVAVGRVGRDEG